MSKSRNLSALVLVLLVMSMTIATTTADLAIGEDCYNGSDCGSGLCFFGSQPLMGVMGTCRCNNETNTGCDDGETCINVDSGIPPICTVCGDPKRPCLENWQDCRQLELGGCSLISEKELCPLEFACEDEGILELGSQCSAHFECQSGTCSDDASLVEPPECVCNLETNAGCSVLESCVTLVGDARPSCVLNLGSPCDPEESSMCISSFCLDGICQCNPIMHTGCAESQECVGDDANGYQCNDLDPLLPIGAPCDFDNSVCETERCFFSFWAREGHCSCNTDTDAGCPVGIECVVDTVNDGAPFCALPDGAACELEGQMECSNGGCCKSGTCVNDVCEAAPLKPFGSKCRENSDCDTQYCYHGLKPPDTAGICQCNPTTNSGCSDDRTCTTSDQIADIPPFCALPLGSPCNTDDFYECSSGNCFGGTCQCAFWFNTGCTSPQVCLGDETIGYQCVDPNAGDEAPTTTTPSESPTMEPIRISESPTSPSVVDFPAAATDPIDSSATQGPRIELAVALVFSAFLIP